MQPHEIIANMLTDISGASELANEIVKTLRNEGWQLVHDEDHTQGAGMFVPRKRA